MSIIHHQESAGQLLCSPAKPWGIHEAVVTGSCPRCGWVARRKAAKQRATQEERRAA
jgi:hypothetical protein